MDDLLGIIGDEGLMVARMLQRLGGLDQRWTFERLVREVEQLAELLAKRRTLA